MRELVRTMEVVYWTFAVVVAVGLTLLAGLAADHWVHPQTLSRGEIARALTLMGINFALVWPSTIYQGGLIGLQHQVAMNTVTAAVGAARVLGSVAVLVFISATLDAFFVWQIATSAVLTGALGVMLWRALPADTDAPVTFSFERLRATRRFAAGVIGITLLGMLLQQADKVILSKMVTLTSFGYYTFAAAVAVSLARIVGPVNTAFFPRFAELISRDDTQLAVVYHRACQVVSVSVLPVAAVIAIFAPHILLLWTRNPGLVAHTHLLVTVLVIGNAAYSLLVLPYALQLAHGWTRLLFFSNLFAVAVLISAMPVVTRRWDALGAAVVWAAVTAGSVLLQIPLMHRRVLKGELRVWCVDDVGKPLLASCLTAWTASWFIPTAHGSFAVFVTLVAVFALTLSAAALAVAWMRAMAYSLIQRGFGQFASWLRLSPQ
jgi:O-antigen/teichoic acid export membrane protein